MKAESPASTEPNHAPFFRRLLTICRKATPGLVACAVLVPMILLGRGQLASLAASHEVKASVPSPPSVRVVAVADEVIGSGVSYSAVVKELRKAELSFRVGGTLDTLLMVDRGGGRARPVHEGDRVRKGSVLARLEAGDYVRERATATERLAAAEGRLSEAEADFDLAKVDNGRTERLAARNSVTQADVDTTRAKLRNTTAAVEVARREIGSAKVALEQADVNLTYCTLVAPFDNATVAARYVEANERITANQRAFLLLDLSSVVVAFGVPDAVVGKLAIGQAVEISADAVGGDRFAGVIHKIGSTADAQTRTYPVEVRIDQPGALRPGMVATARFRRERRAYLLPLTAIGLGPDRATMVYRVEGEGDKATARQVPVAFDDVVDNRVAIRLDPAGTGLRPGDRVVATGVHRLHDGEAIKVAE